MTPAQLLTLKAAINADPALSAMPMNSDGDYDIAVLLDAIASPEYIVWRTNVSRTEASASMDWTRVDNLSAGKARIWDWMFNAGTINVGDATIRAGIDAVWVGTAADLSVRATVYAASKRPATRAEKILAVGLGTTASPSVMGFEGRLSPADVRAARES